MSIGVGLVVWVAVTRGIFSWEIARYRAKLVTQLPDAVQLVVSATRAGLPVSEAFRVISAEMPSPTRDEFLRVESALAVGDTPDQALLALYRRTGVPEYSIFAVTIGVQSRSGGRLAETMENLAETIRERLSIMARAKALAGEAKVSAIIMCLLPEIAGLIMSLIQPQQMAFLFTDPRGRGMLAFGVITMTIGILTMRQLIGGVSKD